VFSDVPTGSACWYENSIGLVEIVINGGRAADQLALKIGDPIEFNTAEARLDAWH
jgi:S-adenosylmethionine hydrolase